MTIRKGSFELQNFTTTINKIERQWSKVDDLGIFDQIMNDTRNITIDVINDTTRYFGDTKPGGTRNKLGFEDVQEVPLIIPFFTLDGRVSARDVQDLRAYGTPNSAETVNRARMRIMERLQRNHKALREKAMVQAIIGTSFSPNGTVAVQNYYTIFNQTQVTTDFVFSNATTDVAARVETIRTQIRDNSEDEAQSYSMVVLCSPTWFSNFINHANVKGAYTEYQALTGSMVNPNRDRPGADRIERDFMFQNIHFIEYAGQFGTDQLIPAGEAYAFPMGIDSMFEIHYGPSDMIDGANEMAQEMYLAEVRDHRTIEMESETALLAVNTRPELVVKLTMS